MQASVTCSENLHGVPSITTDDASYFAAFQLSTNMVFFAIIILVLLAFFQMHVAIYGRDCERYLPRVRPCVELGDI